LAIRRERRGQLFFSESHILREREPISQDSGSRLSPVSRISQSRSERSDQQMMFPQQGLGIGCDTVVGEQPEAQLKRTIPLTTGFPLSPFRKFSQGIEIPSDVGEKGEAAFSDPDSLKSGSRDCKALSPLFELQYEFQFVSDSSDLPKQRRKFRISSFGRTYSSQCRSAD